MQLQIIEISLRDKYYYGMNAYYDDMNAYYDNINSYYGKINGNFVYNRANFVKFKYKWRFIPWITVIFQNKYQEGGKHAMNKAKYGLPENSYFSYRAGVHVQYDIV